MSDRRVADLADLLRPGDVLVFNDTRVIPAQLEGRRGDARVGVTLHKRAGLRSWWAFVRNAKRVRDGDVVDFGHGVSATAVERDDGGRDPLRLCRRRAGRSAARARRAHAAAALHRLEAPDRRRRRRRLSDDVRARGRRGRRADRRAPLHRRDDRRARCQGRARETLTLHVGAGTFLPVKVDDTADHRMHAEWGRIDQATADRLNAARAAGGRLIAVGTTSLRLIESAARRRRHDRSRSKATPRSSSRRATASARSTG